MNHKIKRWSSSSPGRSRMVSFENIVWVVSTVANVPDFNAEVIKCLSSLEESLMEAGSDKNHLLSVQVILQKIENREAFNTIWNDWIGSDPGSWPQRAVYGANLVPGLEIEIIATAAVI